MRDLEMKLKELELHTDAKLAEIKAELIKWVLAISAGQAALIISVIKFLH